MKAFLVIVLIGSVLLVSSPSSAQSAPASPPSGHRALRWVGAGLIGVGAFAILVTATGQSAPAHKRTVGIAGAAVAAAGAVTIALNKHQNTRIELGPRQIRLVRTW